MTDTYFLSAHTFLMSYDQDVLELQDDPTSYISEVERELEARHPNAFAFDLHGNKVWPVTVMMAHHQITGVPQWPQQRTASLP